MAFERGQHNRWQVVHWPVRLRCDTPETRPQDIDTDVERSIWYPRRPAVVARNEFGLSRIVLICAWISSAVLPAASARIREDLPQLRQGRAGEVPEQRLNQTAERRQTLPNAEGATTGLTSGSMSLPALS
jgi:hypothetical protein